MEAVSTAVNSITRSAATLQKHAAALEAQSAASARRDETTHALLADALSRMGGGGGASATGAGGAHGAPGTPAVTSPVPADMAAAAAREREKAVEEKVMSLQRAGSYEEAFTTALKQQVKKRMGTPDELIIQEAQHQRDQAPT